MLWEPPTIVLYSESKVRPRECFRGAHENSTGSPPSAKPNTGGQCSIHIYRFDINADNGNKHFDLVAIIKDTKGIIVGFVGDGDLSKPSISVAGQLPHPVVFTATDQKNKNAPIHIQYDKTSFSTSDKVCKLTKYKKGKEEGDCTFPC